MSLHVQHVTLSIILTRLFVKCFQINMKGPQVAHNSKNACGLKMAECFGLLQRMRRHAVITQDYLTLISKQACISMARGASLVELNSVQTPIYYI